MTDERTLTGDELDALEREWQMHLDDTGDVTDSGMLEYLRDYMPALIAMARRVAALEAENAELLLTVEKLRDITRIYEDWRYGGK